MARGTRTDLASLVNAVGDNSPVDRPQTQHRPRAAVLEDLVANPQNPRDYLGDLSDLASIAETQLQPALVVTRAAYLRLYPQDEPALGDDARWIVVNGCRRLAAATQYGRTDLEIVIKDEVARDRVTLLAASVTENIGRRNFDVLEEAKAVERLVEECGSATVAAEKLSKTQGWVSQRRALLQLAPELQTALRAGDLAVRLARSLARVPLEEQVDAWQAEQEKAANKPEPKEPSDKPRPTPTAITRLTQTFRRIDAEPADLAEALKEYLGDDGLRDLLAALDGAAAT